MCVCLCSSSVLLCGSWWGEGLFPTTPVWGRPYQANRLYWVLRNPQSSMGGVRSHGWGTGCWLGWTAETGSCHWKNPHLGRTIKKAAFTSPNKWVSLRQRYYVLSQVPKKIDHCKKKFALKRPKLISRGGGMISGKNLGECGGNFINFSVMVETIDFLWGTNLPEIIGNQKILHKSGCEKFPHTF